MRRLVPALAAAALLGALSIAASLAPSLARAEEAALPEVHWSFEGVFGTFDRAAARRGFQVYKEVCSVCHSMNLLHYRNLEALGFNQDEVKAIAASFQVPGEPDSYRVERCNCRRAVLAQAGTHHSAARAFDQRVAACAGMTNLMSWMLGLRLARRLPGFAV